MISYYDWLEKQWRPMQPCSHTLKQCEQWARRRQLLNHLLVEIERGDSSVTRLYASLLSRTLLADPDLMREFGQRVAKLIDVEREVKNAPG